MHISLGSKVYPQPLAAVVDIPSEQPVREPQEPKGFKELADVSCLVPGGGRRHARPLHCTLGCRTLTTLLQRAVPCSWGQVALHQGCCGPLRSCMH